MNQGRFEIYDRENPEIWAAFENLTFSLIKLGKKHYGAKAICEVIRFYPIIGGFGDRMYRVNNTYIKGYALKFMETYPNYKGFFEIRD